MKICLRLPCLCFCLLTAPVFAWNAVGHKLIAQIAYNHLSPETRNKANHLNHALDIVYPVQSFVNASVWLDTIRYQDIKWYDRIHYVNWPFSRDNTPLPPIESVNAIWAMENALATLKSKYAQPFDKGLALRVLIHVTGDIHQPLHATTMASAEHPKGDAGGNLYLIQGGKSGKNLHAYWDNGGGFLVLQDKSRRALRKKAAEITQHWPCNTINTELTPKQWLEESHLTGVNRAYKPARGAIPDAAYEAEVQMISEQRIAQAGCRLAALLNKPNYYHSKRGKYKHGRNN